MVKKTRQEKCKDFDKLVKKSVYFPRKVVKKSVKHVCPEFDMILLGSKVSYIKFAHTSPSRFILYINPNTVRIN